MKPRYFPILVAGMWLPQLVGAQTAARPEPNVNETVRLYTQQSTDEQPDAEKPKSTKDEKSRLAAKMGVAPYLNLSAPRQMEKGAYLGLSTSSAGVALRHQLKLPEGTGLVVDFVQPGSPAEQAGLKQYDLLIKLDDQLLINSEQLAVLVRTFKPGHRIQLTLLRDGDRQTIPVRLSEHELPKLDESGNYFQFTPAPFYVPRQPGDMGGRGAGGGVGPPLAVPPDPQGKAGNSNDIERSLTWLDGKRQITLKLSSDNQRLIILDRPSGKVMWEGSIDSIDQQKGIPDEARSALQRIRQFLKSTSDSADPNKSSNDENPKENAKPGTEDESK